MVAAARPRPAPRRLVESVYLLHSQPPLFNVFVGVGLKLAGPAAPVLYHAAFIGFSLICGLSLYALFRLFGLRATAAAGWTAFYLVSPTAVVFENWLMYTWPMAALIALSAVLFAVLARRPTPLRSLAFFGLIAAISLTRSLYPFAFVLLVVAGALVLLPRHRRAVAIGALVPALLVFGWNLKNELLFGTFSSSSWSGMGLARIVDASLDQRKIAMSDQPESPYQHMLSEADSLQEVPPFAPPAVYERVLGSEPHYGHPALDALAESSGDVNYNHRIYLKAAPLYGEAAIDSLSAHPDAYLRQVAKSIGLFTRPPTDYFGVTSLSDMVGWVNVPFDVALYGNVAWVGHGPIAHVDTIPPALQVGWLVPVALVLVIAGGVWVGVRMIRHPGFQTPTNTTFLYITCVILYTSVVSCLVEYGENERFRMNIEPLLYLAAIVSVRALWCRRRRTERRTAAGSTLEPAAA